MIDYISQEEEQALITDFNILLDKIYLRTFPITLQLTLQFFRRY